MDFSADSFGQFLRDLLRDRGITPLELARQIGRTERTVYNWLGSARPPRDAAALLSDALHVPLERMRHAASAASSSEARHPRYTSSSAEDQGLDPLAYLRELGVSAGTTMCEPHVPQIANYDACAADADDKVARFESVAAGTLGLRDIEQLTAGTARNGQFKVRIAGESMVPDYPDACWVTFSRPRALADGVVDQKDYLVWTIADESTFKRVTRDPADPGQYLVLVPLNPDRERHRPLRLHRREVAYLARALAKEIVVP